MIDKAQFDLDSITYTVPSNHEPQIITPPDSLIKAYKDKTDIIEVLLSPFDRDGDFLTLILESPESFTSFIKIKSDRILITPDEVRE